MKKSILILFSITFLFMSSIVAKNLLRYPESAAYNANNNTYYVSNQETGTIVKIDEEGQQEIFAEGMATTIGLAIRNDAIYAIGNNKVHGFSLKDGTKIFSVNVNGAIKLNDITFDKEGNIYSSDVLGNKIYKISIVDSSYEIILDEGIEGPNGILYEEEDNRLLICSWRTNSPIQALDLTTYELSTVAEIGLSNCDGLANDLDGNYYVSEWADMSIHKYDSNFTLPGEVIYTNNGAPADIFYNPYKQEIAVPLVLGHKLDIVPMSTSPVDNDLERIVFYSGRDGNNEIYIMKPDGTEQKNLTNNSASDLCPSISYDGSRIAFLSDRDGNQDIYLMNIDGTNIHKLTNSSTSIEHPSWSYDGSKIYFMKDYGGKTEIWVMDADGDNKQQLTSNNARDERPFSSPDGTKILFMSNRDGNYEIYTMNIDGSNQKRITNSPGHEIFPTWSPDGSKIAYSNNSFSGGQPQAEIHICNVDGSEDVAITSAPGRDENPCWSPDGNSIVFQSERDDNFELYTISIDGSNQTRLTNSPQWDGWASWTQSQVSSIGYNDEIPKQGKLCYNYPNPFNPTTTIEYTIPMKRQGSLATFNTKLTVYDILGKVVATLV